jgi:hypothetical protein
MPLTFTLGENDVLTKIRTIPGVDVLEGEYAPDFWKPTVDDNGNFIPYLTVKFNGAFPANDNGIVGPEKDTQRVSVSIYIIAPDSNISRQIRDQVTTVLLTDFKPTDGSSLRSAGSLSFIDTSLGHKRYVSSVSFNYLANLS